MDPNLFRIDGEQLFEVLIAIGCAVVLRRASPDVFGAVSNAQKAQLDHEKQIRSKQQAAAAPYEKCDA